MNILNLGIGSSIVSKIDLVGELLIYTIDRKLKKFLEIYPEYTHLFPYFIRADKKYIVRAEYTDDNRLNRIEFGYAGDCWNIPKCPLVSD